MARVKERFINSIESEIKEVLLEKGLDKGMLRL